MKLTQMATGAAASAAATVVTTAKTVVKARAAAEAVTPAAAFMLISSWFVMVSDCFLPGLSWFLIGFLIAWGGYYGHRER